MPIRTDEQIDDICEILKIAWKTSPGQRFCQVFFNALHQPGNHPQYFDPFYIEDTELVDALANWINNHTN